jgi:prepilin-type N-terminal cleavage/methylation domain-containing protein
MARAVGRSCGHERLIRHARGRARGYAERGDTLIEVLLAVVIIGVVVSAFFFAMSTGSMASAAQRDFVTADALLRNYAEAAKSAARSDCPTSTTYTTTTTSLPAGFAVTNTAGFVGTDGVCPADTASVQKATLTVTLPDGVAKSLDIDVRTP